LSSPEEEFAMHDVRGWNRYGSDLAYKAVPGAALQSELFRLTPAPGGKGYVFDPIGPPKRPDAYPNFRVHWARVEGGWHVVGIDLPYREQTADD
jgi:hypothetical protein